MSPPAKTPAPSSLERRLRCHFLEKPAGRLYPFAELHMPENPSNKRIRLREVADAAGVSRMTVSLALRDHHSLLPATRKRIQDLARQLGYQPDPAMEQLMEKIRERKEGRFPSIIAYITAHETRDGWRSSFTQTSYYEGAYARAMECGYRLDEFWLREPKMSEGRLSEVLRTRGIEGMIIAPFPRTQVLGEGFHWDYFSVVQLGYSNSNWNFYRCCNHQFQSMKLLVQSLQQSGYRKIGLAMAASEDDRANSNWRGAYLASQSLLPDVRPIPMQLSSNLDKKQFARWFKTHRPEVIVTIGTKIQKWIDELNIEVPNEVGLANVDLSSDMRGMTGINQNSTAVGAAAVDQLIALMRFSVRGIPRVPKLLMVEGTFVKGTTTRFLAIPEVPKSP